MTAAQTGTPEDDLISDILKARSRYHDLYVKNNIGKLLKNDFDIALLGRDHCNRVNCLKTLELRLYKDHGIFIARRYNEKSLMAFATSTILKQSPVSKKPDPNEAMIASIIKKRNQAVNDTTGKPFDLVYLGRDQLRNVPDISILRYDLDYKNDLHLIAVEDSSRLEFSTVSEHNRQHDAKREKDERKVRFVRATIAALLVILIGGLS